MVWVKEEQLHKALSAIVGTKVLHQLYSQEYCFPVLTKFPGELCKAYSPMRILASTS